MTRGLAKPVLPPNAAPAAALARFLAAGEFARPIFGLEADFNDGALCHFAVERRPFRGYEMSTRLAGFAEGWLGGFPGFFRLGRLTQIRLVFHPSVAADLDVPLREAPRLGAALALLEAATIEAALRIKQERFLATVTFLPMLAAERRAANQLIPWPAVRTYAHDGNSQICRDSSILRPIGPSLLDDLGPWAERLTALHVEIAARQPCSGHAAMALEAALRRVGATAD